MATKKEARDLGYDTGHDIGDSNFVELFNEYEGDVEVGNEAEFVDWFVSQVGTTEAENYRQYSPFEFTAKEFNDSRDPDGVWDAYNDGVYKGAKQAAKEGLAGCTKVYQLPAG